MLVTDAWLLVAAIMLRHQKRPGPRGTGHVVSRCGAACRQRAYRLREQVRRSRRTSPPGADLGEVTRLLALLLGARPPRRRGGGL